MVILIGTPAEPMAVDVQVADELTETRPPPAAASIREWSERVIEHLGEGVESTEVCVRLVAEGESARLNADFRGLNKPTNVLSFPADINLPVTSDENGSIRRFLGDIVICDPVVIREAARQKKKEADHLAHMVVHGMLHLYGYDHMEPADAEVMENIEREILAQLGIDDPYRES